jgi:hypothetical protein
MAQTPSRKVPPARKAPSKPVTNPLATNPEREQRVRERAYLLWESEGKPHGRDVEYWERARELIGMEESSGAGLLPNPTGKDAPPRKTGVEEAEIQENLGEFPDRLSDQGEVQATPTPKRKTRARAKKPE